MLSVEPAVKYSVSTPDLKVGTKEPMDQVFMLKKLSLCHKLKFSNPYTVWKLQLDVVVLRYFKLWIMLDRITYKVWNIKGLNHQVAKTQGVDNFELQAKTQFLYSINKQNKEVLFNIEQIFEFDVTLELIRSLTEDDTPSVYFWYIYINKVVISVSLFVPEIITHEKNIILVKSFGKFVCLVKKKTIFFRKIVCFERLLFYISLNDPSRLSIVRFFYNTIRSRKILFSLENLVLSELLRA